jgi:hypothetical protein
MRKNTLNFDTRTDFDLERHTFKGADVYLWLELLAHILDQVVEWGQAPEQVIALVQRHERELDQLLKQWRTADKRIARGGNDQIRRCLKVLPLLMPVDEEPLPIAQACSRMLVAMGELEPECRSR